MFEKGDLFEPISFEKACRVKDLPLLARRRKRPIPSILAQKQPLDLLNPFLHAPQSNDNPDSQRNR